MKYLTSTISKGLKKPFKCAIITDKEKKPVKMINDRVELKKILID